MPTKDTVVIALRIPVYVAEALEAEAQRQGVTRHAMLVRWLESRIRKEAGAKVGGGSN